MKDHQDIIRGLDHRARANTRYRPYDSLWALHGAVVRCQLRSLEHESFDYRDARERTVRRGDTLCSPCPVFKSPAR